jgi:hypothetical protein
MHMHRAKIRRNRERTSNATQTNTWVDSEPDSPRPAALTMSSSVAHIFVLLLAGSTSYFLVFVIEVLLSLSQNMFLIVGNLHRS